MCPILDLDGCIGNNRIRKKKQCGYDNISASVPNILEKKDIFIIVHLFCRHQIKKAKCKMYSRVAININLTIGHAGAK